MMRAVAPKAMYNGERFEMLRTKGKEGFCEGKSRMDDEMESYDGDPRLLMKPLEVMLRSYLYRSRFGEGEMCSRAIEGAMI